MHLYLKQIKPIKELIMSAKFTVFKDKAGKFRFNLKAANGEIIAASESYPDQKTVLKGIASVVKSAAAATIVDTTVEAAPKKAALKKAAPKKAAPKKAKSKPAAAKAKAPAKPKAKAKPKAAPKKS